MGVEAVEGKAFLVVVFESCGQGASGAVPGVVDLQHRVGAVAAQEGDLSGAGANRRAHGAAGLCGQALHLSGVQVHDVQIEDALVGVPVVLEAPGGGGEVEGFSVQGERGLGGKGHAVGFGELDAVAAVHVEEPQLAHADGAGVGDSLAGDDPLAIGAEGGLAEPLGGTGGEDLGLAGFHVPHPDLLVPPLVGGVEQLLSIRAEARILVPRRAGGQGGGGAAGQGQLPQIAKQVKDNPVAPRVHIHGDPGALGEGGFPGEAGPMGGFDVPFRNVFFVFPVGVVSGVGRFDCQGGGGEAQEAEADPECEVVHGPCLTRDLLLPVCFPGIALTFRFRRRIACRPDSEATLLP